MRSCFDLHSEVDKLLRSILFDFMKMDVAKGCDPFVFSLDDTNFTVPIDQVRKCTQLSIREEDLPAIHVRVGQANKAAI